MSRYNQLHRAICYQDLRDDLGIQFWKVIQDHTRASLKNDLVLPILFHLEFDSRELHQELELIRANLNHLEFLEQLFFYQFLP